MRYLYIFKVITIITTLIVIGTILSMSYNAEPISPSLRAIGGILCLISLYILVVSMEKDRTEARKRYNKSRREYIEKICKEYYEY